MSFVPSFSSPCDFATQTPEMVAEFLDFKSKLARERGEASVTDLLVSCLIKLSVAEVTVVVPYEPATGSDFDIMLLNSDRSAAIQYRLQAKKLTHNGVLNWQHRSYRELDHPQGTGEQSKTLIRSSAHEKVETLPLYIFYNDADTCTQSGGSIEGISLADGLTVSRLIRELVAARPKRLPHKRIGNLSDLFFPFSTLFCPSELSEGHDMISPSASRQRVFQALETTRARWHETKRLDDDGLRVGWSGQPPDLLPDKQLLPSMPSRRKTDGDVSPSDREFLRMPKMPTKHRSDSLLPIALERALERKGADGIVRAPVRRTKVVLEPK